jgi:hypothetical protein
MRSVCAKNLLVWRYSLTRRSSVRLPDPAANDDRPAPIRDTSGPSSREMSPGARWRLMPHSVAPHPEIGRARLRLRPPTVGRSTVKAAYRAAWTSSLELRMTLKQHAFDPPDQLPTGAGTAANCFRLLATPLRPNCRLLMSDSSTAASPSRSTCSWPYILGSSRIGSRGRAVPARQSLWPLVVVLAAFRVGLKPREL